MPNDDQKALPTKIESKNQTKETLSCFQYRNGSYAFNVCLIICNVFGNDFNPTSLPR